MVLKIVFNSVVRGLHIWVSLILASLALSSVLTLLLGFILSGVAAGGEAEQAYASMGGVALGFSILTGYLSFTTVVGICIRMQQQDIALWQINGLKKRTAGLILMGEVLLVTAIAGLVGAVLAKVLWFPFAGFSRDSGLPPNPELLHPLPRAALVIGVGATAAVAFLSGTHSVFSVVRKNLLSAIDSDSAFHSAKRSVLYKVLLTVGILVAGVGIAELYLVIAHQPEISEAEKIGDFLMVYPGMGLLLCFLFAAIASPVVMLMFRLLAIVPGNVALFLAVREGVARPRLTKALVLPITLAGASVGILFAWISKLEAVMGAIAGAEGSVSAPPKQLAILLGGPVIIACVSGASIVLATMRNRLQDIFVMQLTGSTGRSVVVKSIFESGLYFLVSAVCAFGIVLVNELAMSSALGAGPIPIVEVSFPSAVAVLVPLVGSLVISLLLLVVALFGTTGNSKNRSIGEMV